MYVIHFKLFASRLQIETIGGAYVPKDSPIIIYFNLDKEHSKFGILKEFRKHLHINRIDWIEPHENLTEEWIIDLKGLKESFEMLSKEDYLDKMILMEPEYEKKQSNDVMTDELLTETIVKFKIVPNELVVYSPGDKYEYSSDLREPLIKFYKDHPQNSQCAFLMMKYENSSLQSKIVQRLKQIFGKHNLELLRADDKYYSDDLLTNIRTYMHGCTFGVAIFDRINTEYFNPNVSLEIGYMMALKKPILFLKDATLKSLHTDLVGKLYEEFDFQHYRKTFDRPVIKWLKHHDLIKLPPTRSV